MLGNLLDFAGSLIQGREIRKQSKANRAQAQAQFDQQMDYSIQRRVKDASKAGIHPLFAMGASSGASPTMSAGDQPTGSGLGDAVRGLGKNLAGRKMNAAAVRAAEAGASRDEAEAALINSERKRLEQDLVSRGHDGASVTQPSTPDPDVVYGPAEYVKPEVPVSKRPGVRAGTAPGEMEVLMPDGRKVMLYDPDLGLDEIGQFKFAYQRAVHGVADALTWIRNKLKQRPLMRIRKGPSDVQKLYRNTRTRPIQRRKSQ